MKIVELIARLLGAGHLELRYRRHLTKYAREEELERRYHLFFWKNVGTAGTESK